MKKFERLYEIKQSYSKYAIFGAGKSGKSFLFDMIELAGFIVECYFDNNIENGAPVRNGLIVKEIDYLYSQKQTMFIFLCVRERYRKPIEKQLIDHGIDFLYLNKKYFYEVLNEIEQEPVGEKEKFAILLDDTAYLKRQFAFHMGYELDLSNPKTFNEKIQWLKLHYRNEACTMCADKAEVKRFVEKRIGKKYVVDTYGIWDDYKSINYDSLPNEFVLKCTHDSGGVIICEDKNYIDLDEISRFMGNRFSYNYYWFNREWCYKGIRPRIIAEKYLGNNINDYKIFCFNGEPQLIQVDFDRLTNHKRNLYSTKWEYIDGEIKYPTDRNHIIEKPESLEEMLDVSRALSQGFPHVRIDLYYVDNQIYFGEMTFFHGAGYESFVPRDLGVKMGEFLDLTGLMVTES